MPQMDYQSNAKNPKIRPIPKVDKVVEKVVTSEVIVKKRTLGQRFHDTFIKADFRTVAHGVFSDVLLPAAINMIYDAVNKATGRMLFGEAASRRMMYGGYGAPRVTYNRPMTPGYGYSSLPVRTAPPVSELPRTASLRPGPGRDNFILTSKEEAELVLERLNDIIDTYGQASVADLNDLVGFPTTHIDNKWGWYFLGDTQVLQVREGFLINLPQAEPIQT